MNQPMSMVGLSPYIVIFLIGKVRFNNMRFGGTQFSDPAGCFCWAFVGPLRGLGLVYPPTKRANDW